MNGGRGRPPGDPRSPGTGGSSPLVSVVLLLILVGVGALVLKALGVL